MACKGIEPISYSIRHSIELIAINANQQSVGRYANLQIGAHTRESNRALNIENILSFPNIDDAGIKVKRRTRVLLYLCRYPLIHLRSVSLDVYIQRNTVCKLVAPPGVKPGSLDWKSSELIDIRWGHKKCAAFLRLNYPRFTGGEGLSLCFCIQKTRRSFVHV